MNRSIEEAISRRKEKRDAIKDGLKDESAGEDEDSTGSVKCPSQFIMAKHIMLTVKEADEALERARDIIEAFEVLQQARRGAKVAHAAGTAKKRRKGPTCDRRPACQRTTDMQSWQVSCMKLLQTTKSIRAAATSASVAQKPRKRADHHGPVDADDDDEDDMVMLTGEDDLEVKSQ
jgi:hypothetical protein